uniref:CDI domain-containing protein n=1 Tax=Parastrongyloides trichosuri TaxID=131310 RepID=A0A0N4Z227_PARTI
MSATTITMIISPSMSTSLHQSPNTSMRNSSNFTTPRKNSSRGINKKKAVNRKLFNTYMPNSNTDIFLDNLLSDIYSKYNKKYDYDFEMDCPMKDSSFKPMEITSVPSFYITNRRSLSPEVVENLCPTMTSTKLCKESKGSKQMKLTDFLNAKRKSTNKNYDSMKLSRTPLKSRPFGANNATNITMTC